jgi:hypothetical protein
MLPLKVWAKMIVFAPGTVFARATASRKLQSAPLQRLSS